MEEQQITPLSTWVMLGCMALAFVGLIGYFIFINATVSPDSYYMDFSDNEIQFHEERAAKKAAAASAVENR